MSLRKQIRKLWDEYYLICEDEVKNEVTDVFKLNDVADWFNQRLVRLQDAIAQMFTAAKNGELPSAEVRASLAELEEYYRLLDFTTETDNQIKRIDSAHMIKIPNETQEQKQLELFGEVRLFDPEAYLVISDNTRVSAQDAQLAQFEESHRHTLAEYDRIIVDTQRAKRIRQTHDDIRRNAWTRRYKKWGQLERAIFGYKDPERPREI
jgi:hypothetical protein